MCCYVISWTRGDNGRYSAGWGSKRSPQNGNDATNVTYRRDGTGYTRRRLTIARRNPWQSYVHQKRSIEIDRVEFEECRQAVNETFDNFYVRLRQMASSADLCNVCMDTRLKKRIISGFQNQETRRKLLAINPPPSLQQHRTKQSWVIRKSPTTRRRRRDKITARIEQSPIFV